MENCPVRVNTIGQLYTDCMSDRKSRFWQIDNQPNLRSDAICPQPRRAAKVPYLIHTFNGVISKPPKGILPMHRVDCAPEILDLILSQNDPYNEPDSSNQVGFICGSPPIRTSNPVVHDVQFAKQAQSSASPLGNSPRMKHAGIVETGSPTCGSSRGGSPKARIEGFACGSSEKQHVAPALA